MLEFSIITIGSFVTMLDSITKYIGKFCFKKDISKVIPIFSIIYGVALGICGFYTPSVEMGNNLIEAIFIGISAGAAATGVNQVGKQLNKKDDDEDSKSIDDWTEEDWARAREMILNIMNGNTGSTNTTGLGDILLFGNNPKDVVDELNITPVKDKTDEEDSVEEEKENIEEEIEDVAPDDYGEKE